MFYGSRTMMGQMVFGDLNASVAFADEHRLSKQAQKILQALRQKPLANIEIVKFALAYRARIWEIRRWLAGRGECVDVERKGNGVNIYKIVPLTDALVKRYRLLPYV